MHLQQQLQSLDESHLTWFEPFQSPVAQFRNKAKMVVSGAVERPILGILPNPLDPKSAVDLCDCPLYPQRFQALFPILKDFIARAGLVPYNVAKQNGGGFPDEVGGFAGGVDDDGDGAACELLDDLRGPGVVVQAQVEDHQGAACRPHDVV